MHPTIVIFLSAVLRVVCLWLALGRMLGLSLAGGSDIFWQHLPALALLYFAFAPKPKPNARVHVLVSVALFVAGVTAVVIEALRWRGLQSGGVILELAVLTLSAALHCIYAAWKSRSDVWGRWQLV